MPLRHPSLRVMPVCADYTAELHLPRDWCHGARSSLIFFPGSTIGSFEPAEAELFLALLARMVGGSEMRLNSRKNRAIAINGRTIHFTRDEPIRTEHSYKDSVGGFRRLAASAGFRSLRVWTDAHRRFSLHLLAFG